MITLKRASPTRLTLAQMAKLQKMANASGLTDYDVEKHNRNRSNNATPLQGHQMQLGYIKNRKRANFSNMSPMMATE